MPLSEQDRERIESFRAYIQDTVATDDRYGPAERKDSSDQSMLSTRFMEGRSSWFEVAVRPAKREVRVGFFTTDAAINEDCEQVIAESGVSPERFVGEAFAEIGMDWSDPPVEHGVDVGASFYATALMLDEFVDLDGDDLRDRTLLMLEGYLLAFGPALGAEESDG